MVEQYDAFKGIDPNDLLIFAQVAQLGSFSRAAERLGMNPQLLRLGLQQDRFPFGTAIKTSRKRWSYYINRQKFFEYLNGQSENERHDAQKKGAGVL